DAHGITAFIVPRDASGLTIEFYWWTFNMPTDHAEVSLRGVRVAGDAILGELGGGLALAQRFVHENRIRQAASSLGAAAFCIDEAVQWARARTVWGQPLWRDGIPPPHALRAHLPPPPPLPHHRGLGGGAAAKGRLQALQPVSAPSAKSPAAHPPVSGARCGRRALPAR